MPNMIDGLAIIVFFCIFNFVDDLDVSTMSIEANFVHIMNLHSFIFKFMSKYEEM